MRFCNDIDLSEFDNVTDAILSAIPNALLQGGLEIETEAKLRCPHDTGRLRNSISTDVLNDRTVAVGTSVEYASYIEYGTGLFAENGKGRKTPWAWNPANGGRNPSNTVKWRGWHTTSGMPAQPFLRPAFDAGRKECVQAIKECLDDAAREAGK